MVRARHDRKLCGGAQVRDWNVPKLVCTSTSTSTSTGPQQQLSTAAASLIIVTRCLGPATSHTPTVSLLLAGACGASSLRRSAM